MIPLESPLPMPPELPSHHEIRHGIVFDDAFHGLRDIANPVVKRYLREENAYFATVSKRWRKVANRVAREIHRRIPEDDVSVPVRIDGWFYYTRTCKGLDYPLYCRKDARIPDAAETVILDLNRLARGVKCCLVTGVTVSPDHGLLLYGINRTGGIDYTIRVRDLNSGKLLPDRISSTDGDAVWAADNRHFFYVKRKRGDLRGWRVMRHELGTPVTSDVVVYQEDDVTFECSVWKTKSDRFIVISASNSNTAEHRFIEAISPDAEFQLMRSRIEGVEYYPEHLANDFYMLSNADGADDFKLLRIPIAQIQTGDFTTILPHRPGVLLEDFELFDSGIAVLERDQALPRIRVLRPRDTNTAFCYEPPLAAPFTLSFEENPNIDVAEMRIAYSSLKMPGVIATVSLADGAETRLKTRIVPGYDPDDYESEMIRVPSRDGTVMIPLSLVWRRDCAGQGPMPLLMRAYGAYGITSDPAFRPSRISLMDRGAMFAIAHVRGGEELGRAWYDGGRLMHKKNTFTDTIDCAEHLIATGRTAPDRLVISGGSAGGLLVGAVINERPDLFLGAVMEVPFVDVINTMCDPTLPLTTGEYKEWGDPGDSEAFRYILSYSPYDNICAQRYPHIFLTGNLNDSQVPFWEPAKFAAKLRREADPGSLVLLRTDMESGHLGRTGRKAEIVETARELAFALYLFGVES